MASLGGLGSTYPGQTYVGSGMFIGSYSDIPVGAFPLTGSVSESWFVTIVHTEAVSGTLPLAGSRAEAKLIADAVSGALSVAGSSTDSWVVSIIHSDVTTGNLPFAGSHSESWSRPGITDDTVAGTLPLAGSQGESLTHSEVIAASLAFVGTSIEAKLGLDSGSGLFPLSGSSADVYVAPRIGNMSIGGYSTSFAAFDVTVAGSMLMTGVHSEHYFLAKVQPTYSDVRYYTGDEDHWLPRDIRNQRISSLEVMQRMGTPVLLKRIFTVDEVDKGIAQESPTMDDIYKQSTYAQDALSHGVGYVSVETQDGEWYDPTDGKLYIDPVSPDPSYLPAARYRGYNRGYLTYAILPDRPEDVWKLTPQGTLIRQQTAMVQLPWWPQVGDNDLLITCRLDDNGFIAETYERYQLKMVTPTTMRGLDRSGRREFDVNAGGNRFWVGQQAEAVIVPKTDNIYTVEVDR